MNKKLFRIFLFLLLILGVVLVTLFGQGYFRYERETEVMPLDKAVEAYTGKDDYVSYDQIDQDFVHAVVSVEDKRFFERKGYDLIALCRALYHNFLAKDFIEGGSTISEQIAKNLYLGGFINGLEEKTAGIFLMMALEQKYSKKELFALYANMNYYGDGYWGIGEAAEGYYGCSADDLSLGQAAILAGIPNAPAIYQLSDGYEQAKERQAWVLQTMANNNYISEKEMTEALAEDVHPIIKKQP
ncbi:MAG: transglycosylase domain-containing protein [Erysipelotrichaceae bacterium]|nr:transglycosylase domain-containing protein [Erysipelotrichaceae bacterium]